MTSVFLHACRRFGATRRAARGRLLLVLLAALVPRMATLHGQSGAAAELLTVTPQGVAGGGEEFGNDALFGTGQTTISQDNRFVVFSSASPLLVPGDGNGVQDIFVRDRVTGTTTLISRASDGTQGNAPAGQPAISADGRYVAFISAATNLVPGDTNQQIDPGLGTPNPYSGYDVFVHDRTTGTTVRASVSSTNLQADSGVNNLAPAISADGRFVAFTSPSANLAPGDPDRFNNDIYVRDLVGGTTERVSLRPFDPANPSATPEIIGADAYTPSISADGRRVAFVVFDNTLSGPTPQVPANLTRGVYVRDRAAGTTTLVSARTDGTPATLLISDFPAISADGRFVSFSSWEDLDPANPDELQEVPLDGPFADIFVRDLSTATTRRVSLPFPGGPAEESGRLSAISGDGRFVLYSNSANPQDLVVRDMLLNRSQVVRAPDGSAPVHFSPTLSLDGRWAFIESFTDLLPSDTNGIVDAYLLPVPPAAGADLSLTLAASPLQPAPGATVTLTVGVSNAGGEDASGVTAALSLPPGLALVSDNGAGAFSGGTWTIGSLTAGSAASLQVVVRADGLAPESVTAQVMTASPVDPDSTPGNSVTGEDDQKTTTITPQAIDLALSLNANTLTPLRQSNVTLTVGVNNSGVIAATGVTARLPLPAGLTHVSSSGPGTYDPATGLWTIGTIAPGGTPVLQLVARVTAATTLEIPAEVETANETDRDSTPGNHAAAEDDQAMLTLVPVDAGIVVNDATGAVSPTDGRCTLVEAIVAANTDLPSGNAIGECAGGSGADVIHLRALAPPYTLTTVNNTLRGYNGLPAVTSPITIDATGQTIRRSPTAGTPPFRLFYVAPGGSLTLDHAVVRDGLAADPAGLNPVAYYGAGVLNDGALTVRGGGLTNNNAGCDGGGVLSTGPLTVSDGAVVEANNAGCSGGGIAGFYAGAITVTDTIIRNNGALSGAGFYVHGTTTATLTNVRIEANVAANDGGGVFTHNADANLTINDSLILNNVAGAGQGGGISNGRLVTAGGVSVPGGTMLVTGSVVTGNRSSGLGGGIANAGPLTVATTRIESNVVSGPFNFCGGGVYSAAPTLIQDTSVAFNQAFNGGGVCLTHNGSIVGGSVRSNSASNVGGGVALGFVALAGLPSRSVTLSGVTVTTNTSVASGGGIYLAAAAAADSLTLDRVVVQQNGATGSTARGGGLLVRGGRVTLQNDTRILNNVAAVAGGGIATESTSGGCCDGAFTMQGGLVDGNTANGGLAVNGGGGGIAHFATAAASVMTLTGVTITSNHAPGGGNGGGIFNAGVLQVTGGEISLNDAQSGAGVANGTSNLAGGPATFTNTSIIGNIATTLGGGLFAANPPGGPATGTTTISGGAVSGNRAVDGGGVFLRPNTTVRLERMTAYANAATGSGGGGYSTGTLIVVDSQFAGNGADAGAGLFLSGTTTIRTSTLAGNGARLGGAIRASGGVVDVTNTTISGNVATASAGALDVVGAPGAVPATRVNLLATTIANNVGLPGGIGNGAFMQISHSILAGNRQPAGAASECAPALVPGSPPATFQYLDNVIGQDAGCVIATNNGGQRTIDEALVFSALIGPLTDNGGPTPTHALLDGSLAIDSISDPIPFGCSVDQRGRLRPVDGDGDGVASCDAGAFERQDASPAPAPVLSSLSPAAAVAPPAVLVVTGSGFGAGSVGLWNGASRVTIVQSPTTLRLELVPGDGVSAQDIATALVTVRGASGAVSNPLTFTTVSARVSRVQSLAAVPGASVSAAVVSPAGGGVSATLVNNTSGSPTATVTVATYNTNPVGGTFFAAGGYFDLQVTGADAADSVAARFYYPGSISGAAEAGLQLRYWTGTVWANVLGAGGAAPDKNTTENLDGVTSGGRFAVTFDASSTPPVTALGGTVFAIGSAEAVTRIVGSGYNAPETAAYRATFSVDASGPGTPSGSVRYSYARTRMTFASTVLNTFAQGSGTVTIEGSGTVNGAAGYTFSATAGTSPGSFAIVIRRSDGSVYYSAPALALAGGSFVISQ